MNTININTVEINGVEYAPVSEMNAVEPVEGSPVGQYCIVRCKDAGVWAGIVKEVDGRNVTVLTARRLWYWKAKKGHTLSAVANYGVSESKFPASVPVVYLTEACEILPCLPEGRDSIIQQGAYNE